ncbi:MAG TPA: DUF2950 family protein [Candidatus Sulfopaludibacter sp.]|nr:DUF2950 family protein [Candidatus Sulfopaludibacter sp.]
MTIRFCALSVLTAMVCAAPAIGQEQFDTPEAAAQALMDAASSHDAARLASIMGPQAGGILTSGTPAQDRDEQSEFARLAGAKLQIQISPMNPNRAILSIGEEDWPFPVPIRRGNGKWSFDPSETRAEMHARRIGADELDAIEICHGYVEAQTKYASEDRDQDGLLEYSSRLMSSPGRHDGLYWQGASEPLVPEGFARAAWTGPQKGDAKPYHGYYFRVLDGQGDHARGGPHHYLVKGKMIGGYGLVAWPADYGVTGIHTFIVNQDGVVYQKDIEPVPGKPPLAITRFDPDPSWEPVE